MYAIVLAILFSALSCDAAISADTTIAVRKSPSTAVLYSFLLPGLGQVYTESYWKVPIFTGAAAASTYFIISNQSSFASASQEYDAALVAGQPAATTATLLRKREFYRNNRDVAGLALLLTYALAAVDAFVGANLYDFNVSSDLSLQLTPTPTSPLALQMQVRF
ncbi:MAG: DUF5683 domain-containing protein [Ignavibacteria bacterium]|jgi:hypothetical protein